MLESINSIEDLKKLGYRELSLLSEDIRERIIEVMKKNGGHLASNLGTVELIIALHYVFNTPQDKIIFDVGHQSYTHKILTGRNKDFDTIRLAEGLSGFTRRSESEHDFTDSGHASVSISQAVGFAQALSLSGKPGRAIAVIGDGALTGGQAFEGLNFTGHTGLPVIVILNDNEMSIGSNVGAISKYLNKVAVSKIYQNLTQDIENSILKTRNPFRAFFHFINKMKKGVKMLFDYENVFTHLGFEYIGPIDGHNLKELIYILERTKSNIKHPVMLHVKTTKGKGVTEAENNPSKFHGVSPLSMINGKLEVKKESSFTDVFSKKIVSMAGKFDNILAITAAMESGTGLSTFAKSFKTRFFDVGIAEQHAVSFAASLAYSGYKPFLAIYSTFLTRAIDQIIQDVSISKAPVVFMIDRAGIVGADGETHHGQFDVSYLRMIPGIIILSPFDDVDLEDAMEYSYFADTPVAIRYPRDSANHVDEIPASYRNNQYKEQFIILKKGYEVLYIVIGPFVDEALGAVRDGIDGLIVLRFIKPVPYEALIKEMSAYKKVIIIEESVFSGSVSESVSSYLISHNCKPIEFYSATLPDQFIAHGNRKDILENLGFTSIGFRKVVGL